MNIYKYCIKSQMISFDLGFVQNADDFFCSRSPSNEEIFKSPTFLNMYRAHDVLGYLSEIYVKCESFH